MATLTKQQLDALNTPPESVLDVDSLPSPEEVERGITSPVQPSIDVDSLPSPKEIESMSPEYTKLRREMDKSLVDFVTESPGLLSTETTDEELAEIAKHHGVNVGDLKKYATFLGATQSDSPIEQEVAGSLGRVALNIPQKLLKVWQSDPNMERAMDDVQSLGSARRSLLRGTAESVVPISTTAQAAGGAAKAATAGGSKLMTALRTAGQAAKPAAVIGGVAGLGYSEKGQELTGAALGTAVGGTLGAGIPAVISATKTVLGPITKAAEKQIEKVVREVDIDGGIEKIAAKNQESEKIIANRVTSDPLKKLTLEESITVLEEQLSPSELAWLMSPDNNAVKRASAVAGREIGPDELIKELAQEKISNRLRETARQVSRERITNDKKAIALIEDFKNREGEQAFLDRYNSVVRSENAGKYLNQSKDRVFRQFGGIGGWLLRAIPDAQFVARMIDRKTNSNVTNILSDTIRSYNKSTFLLGDLRKDEDKLFKFALKAGQGIDDDLVEGNKIYKAVDTGVTEGLSDKEIQTAEMIKRMWAERRQLANNIHRDPRFSDVKPLNIPEANKGNYVPRISKQADEATALINNKLEDTLVEIPNLDKLIGKKDLSEAAKKSKNLSDLIQTVRALGEAPPRTGKDLINTLNKIMYSREGTEILQSISGRVMARGEQQLPEYLLEKNMYKLFSLWDANVTRHIFLRKGINDLTTEAKILEKAGALEEAKYIRTLVNDIMGVRSGTVSQLTSNIKTQIDSKLNRVIDQYGRKSVQGRVAEVTKHIPDMLYTMSKNIYPNALGYLSARAVLQNNTALYTKVAPEIGGLYGAEGINRAMLYSSLNFKRLVEKTKMLGTVPDEFIRAGQRQIAEGIQRSAIYNMSADTIDAVARAGMVVYQTSEKFNRVVCLGMGEVMAKDIAAGKPGAIKAMKRLPPNIQKKLKVATSTEEIANIIGIHLNDVTQYNYNRIALSEFGRFVGPFFSAFTKWPSATAGEIMTEYYENGKGAATMRVAEKFLAPLIGLQTMDIILGGERQGEDKSVLGTLRFLTGMGNVDEDNQDPLVAGMTSDVYKKLVGSSGLSQAAPIRSLGPILNGEIYSSQFLDAIMEGTVNPAIEGDAGKAYKGVANFVNMYVPAAGAARFVTDDVVTYITGERPQGTSFFERTAEGARIIDKELSK